MTEHAAVIFVFFFLAEYGSMVLMCILTSILFIGGYLTLDLSSYIFTILYSIFSIVHSTIDVLRYYDIYLYIILTDWMTYIEYYVYWLINVEYYIEYVITSPIIEGLLYGLSLGLKSCLMIFTFIWARASFPRIRFDQLMAFCWTVLLPVVFALIILVPCVLYSFNIFPINIALY